MLLSPERLREVLSANIVGERNLRTSPEHHATVARHIGQVFAACGFSVREQQVPGPAGAGRNIIGHREGDGGLVGGRGEGGQSERCWILGAHYDTVTGTPGADDNGIAVAGLLETARMLSGYTFRDSVELVAWDQEEPQPMAPGITRGSRTMARADRRAGRRLDGVMVLEMIGCCRHEPHSQRFPPGFGLFFPGLRRWLAGRGNRGDFLAVVCTPPSRRLAEAIARSAERFDLPLATILVRGAARLIPDFYRSDHTPFWSRRYPAVMLTDTANFRNRNYHRPGDTIDTIDFDFAAKVMSTAVDALLTQAGGKPTAMSAGWRAQEESRHLPEEEQQHQTDRQPTGGW